VDCIATKEGKSIGVFIKHRRVFSLQDIDKLIADRSSESEFDELLLVTSAQVAASQTTTLLSAQLGHNFKIIAFDELQQLISKHSEIAQKSLAPLRKEQLHNLWGLVGAIAGLIIGILGVLNSSGVFTKPNHPLDDRIKNVESALANIRDLEGALNNIKDDMVATENATREINKQNAAAKELQNLNDASIELLINKSKSEKWWQTALGWGFSFLTGIATSYIASVFFEKRKQRIALESES